MPTLHKPEVAEVIEILLDDFEKVFKIKEIVKILGNQKIN